MSKLIKSILAIHLSNPACSHTVQIGDKLCTCELKHGHEGTHLFRVKRRGGLL